MTDRAAAVRARWLRRANRTRAVHVLVLIAVVALLIAPRLLSLASFAFGLWIFAGFLATTSIALLVTIVRYRRFRQRILRVPIKLAGEQPEPVARALQAACDVLGQGRRLLDVHLDPRRFDAVVSVLEHEGRAHLLVPLGFLKIARTDPEAATALLGHELAHLRQHDTTVGLATVTFARFAVGAYIVYLLLAVALSIALPATVAYVKRGKSGRAKLELERIRGGATQYYYDGHPTPPCKPGNCVPSGTGEFSMNKGRVSAFKWAPNTAPAAGGGLPSETRRSAEPARPKSSRAARPPGFDHDQPLSRSIPRTSTTRDSARPSVIWWFVLVGIDIVLNVLLLIVPLSLVRRRSEYLADLGGASVSGPEAMIRALEQVGPQRSRWWRLGFVHPSRRRRIKRIERATRA